MVIPDQKGSSKREKSNYWDFVFNNYDDESVNHLIFMADKESNKKIFRSFIFEKEVGENGTPHLQGYIKLNKRQYKTWLLNSWMNDGILKNKISFRRCRNIKATINYVQKDNTVIYKRMSDEDDKHEQEQKYTCDEWLEHVSKHNGPIVLWGGRKHWHEIRDWLEMGMMDWDEELYDKAYRMIRLYSGCKVCDEQYDEKLLNVEE